MDCTNPEDCNAHPPPPLLSTLNPAPGRFKPRARLLTMRPKRSSLLCMKAIQHQPTIDSNFEPPLKAIDPPMASSYQTCAPIIHQTPQGNSDRHPHSIQRFIKRCSVRFSANQVPNAQPVEVEKRLSNRFSFNSWRRRKSLSKFNNSSERDRSPLKATHLVPDEHKAAFQSANLSVTKTDSLTSSQTDASVISVELAEKENDPIRRSKTIQHWSGKRRSLWNFSAISSATSSTISVSASSEAPTHMTVPTPYATEAHELSAQTDADLKPKPLSTPYPCKRKCSFHHRQTIYTSRRRPRSTLRFSENQNLKPIERVHSSQSLQLGTAGHATFRGMDAISLTSSITDTTASVTPSLSCATQESGHSTPQLIPIQLNQHEQHAVFHSSPSSQTDSSLWQSCNRLSRCSLELNQSHPGWTADKLQGQDSGVSSEVSTSSAQTAELNDIADEPVDLAEGVAEAEGAMTITTDIDCGLSHSPVLPRRYAVRNGSGMKVPDTMWATRLRRSLDRAGRQCRLQAGRTLFNKNPLEGMQYFLDHGLIPRVPAAIARFLLNTSDLNRQAIGEYFGSLVDTMATQVLTEYLQLLNLQNLEVDEALRVVLEHFHPVGESQKISRLMQTFQETYTMQNAQRVAENFRDPETIEVLAYSILLLHTDLHNPNVRRVGKRMTKQEFVLNNRGIDADQDLPVDMLHAIYDRISGTQFKTLPDAFDRLRQLDALLTGPLKTDNFLQRHRRFVGWVAAHQVDNIISRRSPKRPHGRWRHLLIFNDILIVAKPVASGSLLNLAAAAAMGEPTNGGPAPNFRRKSLSTDRIVEHRLRPRNGADSRNQIYLSTEPMTTGTYNVRLVLPLIDLQVSVFATHYHQFGVQLCNNTGPLLHVNLVSAEARQKFIDWLHGSIAEMTELRSYYRTKAEQKPPEQAATEAKSSKNSGFQTRF